MEALEKPLVNKIRKIVAMQDSCYNIIDVENKPWWYAIVVEDEFSQDRLFDYLTDLTEGKYEAVIKCGDYEDFSCEEPQDLRKECFDWKVVYVYSESFWRMKRIYGRSF